MCADEDVGDDDVRGRRPALFRWGAAEPALVSRRRHENSGVEFGRCVLQEVRDDGGDVSPGMTARPWSSSTCGGRDARASLSGTISRKGVRKRTHTEPTAYFFFTPPP